MGFSDMTDEILPFTTQSPSEGIGRIETIVSIDSNKHEEGITYDGNDVCNFCGYDRAKKIYHTEAPGKVVECKSCRMVIHKDI